MWTNYISAFLALIFDFALSWLLAYFCGRYWSESKVTKSEYGGFRAYIVGGYVLSIIGFYIVYFYLLLMIVPIFLEGKQNLTFEPAELRAFAQRLIKWLWLFAPVPSLLLAFFKLITRNWRNSILGTFITGSSSLGGYDPVASQVSTSRGMDNAYYAIRRSVSRPHYRSSSSSSSSSRSSSKSSKNNGGAEVVIIMLAIVAILSGFLTASAIMKKADRDFNGLPEPTPERG